MRTIIINTSKFSGLSIEQAICEILNHNSVQDFQVSVEEPKNDYREIIEYDNEEETSLYWSIVNINRNEDESVYSVDIDC
jgi:hypothetical protein